ncbi:hypothetical protein [Streptomyces sp. NPDC101145]|uniref:hypothetical protein n=1 Tax=Streptomyces sp. NPDC101145 TaxID=3366112 RepID=UPI003800C69B
MGTPAPPRRICTRYNADGSRCTARTVRGDGWCGDCDGYTSRAPDEGLRPRWHWGDHDWQPAALGLEVDEAYEVDIHPRVVRDYSAHHRVTPKVAIHELRSLLEDLLIAGESAETDDGGYWRIFAARDGYGLMLSPDRSTILRYCTRHLERTWAQHRGGVASRLAKRHGSTAWCREALAKYTSLPVYASPMSNYARHVLGMKLNRGTVDTVAENLVAHLEECVLPKWRRTAREQIDDGQGTVWVLVVDERAPDGAVIASFAADAKGV